MLDTALLSSVASQMMANRKAIMVNLNPLPIRRTSGQHVEFVITQPDPVPAPPSPAPPLEESAPTTSRRVARREQPAKLGPPMDRSGLNLDLVSSPGDSRSRHREDLFEL